MMRKELLVEAKSFFDDANDEFNKKIEIELILVDIASEFIKYRAVKSISQKELAGILEISQAMVSKLESGDYNPTVKFLFEISKKLNWDFSVSINSNIDPAGYHYTSGNRYCISIMKNYISPFSIDKSSVAKFTLTQSNMDVSNRFVEVSIGADYEILKIERNKGNHVAQMDLKLLIDGKYENKSVFTIEMIMTGNFSANYNEIDNQKFIKMLEVNGLTTLMQLSRAYITAVTALSGFGRPIHFPMVNILKLVEMKNKGLANHLEERTNE